ncbi:MAG TPA: hypothetical protein VGB73_07535 [Pyrinomonadaceae bacterium]
MAQSGRPARRTSGKTASTTKTTAAPAKQSANTSTRAEPTPADAAPAIKRNAREAENSAAQADVLGSKEASKEKATTEAEANGVRYVYEFNQPESSITHIRIEHDARGAGRISFERKTYAEPVEDPFQLSPKALERINALWEALHFLDTDASYQAVKQFPHMGTTRLQMARGGRERSADFNWTDDANASALAREYRRAADQAMLVFEIDVALENQPLELPKLLTHFEKYLERDALSDPLQLVPLLRSLQTDERVPLIARNHAGRLLKKLEK